MIVLFIIAVGLVLFGITYFFIGFPLVIAEQIKDYRNGLTDKKQKRLWKIAFVLWSIVLLFAGFLYLLYKLNH